MIIRSLADEPDSGEVDEDAAWHLVEESQRGTALPVLLIPQPAHAVLAGDLAEALLPGAFGELPATVLRTIRMHDTGWGILDAAQINRLRTPPGRQEDKGRKPSSADVISFLAVTPSEAVEAWKSSVDEMEKIAPECGHIVSQHFSLLASSDDRVHAVFMKQERTRRERLLKIVKSSVADLERWTDALGFCDLLSLYLCSGVKAAATLPRCHPRRKSKSPLIRVRQEGESLVLSEPWIRPGTRVGIHGLRQPAPPAGSAAQEVRWRFD